MAVLPKHFSTATQFLERQSIATHIALLDKKKLVLKRKYYFYLLLNIILQKPSPNFVLFFTSPFLTIFYFYIIKKSHFKNFSRPTTIRVSTHQLRETLIYGIYCRGS
jgi:hypothetical protein